MNNSIMSVEIVSFDEKFNDKNGVLNYRGYVNFPKYSKDGYMEETMPFQAKGSAAKELDEAGIGKSGVAIGYLDLQVVDTGKGYKQKVCTFVIRNFIPTVNTTDPELVRPITVNTTDPELGQPVSEVPVLVAATASNNGKTAITDIANIPF